MGPALLMQVTLSCPLFSWQSTGNPHSPAEGQRRRGWPRTPSLAILLLAYVPLKNGIACSVFLDVRRTDGGMWVRVGVDGWVGRCETRRTGR